MSRLEINGLSGIVRAAATPVANGPLIVAVHGGTYSSAYFDLPGHSLLDRAALNGVTAIAIDRPGYGDSAMLAPEAMDIAGQGAYLTAKLAELWAEHDADHAGLFIVGHSIGAAITATIAAHADDLPLLGIALSGIGVRTPSEHAGLWAALPDLPHVEMPGAIKDQLMFGPADSFSGVMPAASHAADAPCPKAELIDITGDWQRRAPGVLGRIAVPVHYRQAGHDHLWIVDQDEVDGFAAMLPASPRVDAALFRGAGHCIDFHHGGAGLQLQQIGFALQCAAEARA